MRKILALIVLSLAAAAHAAAPQTGIWWNPNEAGRGYSIDVEGNTLVMIAYAYGLDGRMQWYYADGPLLNGGARWSGTLFKFDFGQPLGGAYVPAVNVGTEGVATIDFLSRTRGTLTIGGVQSSIVRYNFGVGSAPQALLGDWIYVYTIGSSNFSERFLYTTILSPTSSGNGVVATSSGNGGAELQVTGSLAGQVVAVHISSTGSILDSYLWTPYLEEGRGAWVSTTTQTQYPLWAYRVVSPSGIAKAASSAPLEAIDEAEKLGSAVERKGVSIEELMRQDPERGRIAMEMRDRLLEHRAAMQRAPSP
jgi:hypothetical protein